MKKFMKWVLVLVVPAVYNSYSAVCDIIDGDKDGIVLPYHKQGYDANEAAGMIAKIMKDDGKREQMEDSKCLFRYFFSNIHNS